MNVCTYCGELADTRDHVVPRSYLNTGTTVPACRQCNGLLSSKLHITIESRAHYLLNNSKVHRRYSPARIAYLRLRAGFERPTRPDTKPLMCKYSESECVWWHKNLIDAWRHGCTAKAFTRHNL